MIRKRFTAKEDAVSYATGLVDGYGLAIRQLGRPVWVMSDHTAEDGYASNYDPDKDWVEGRRIVFAQRDYGSASKSQRARAYALRSIHVKHFQVARRTEGLAARVLRAGITRLRAQPVVVESRFKSPKRPEGNASRQFSGSLAVRLGSEKSTEWKTGQPLTVPSKGVRVESQLAQSLSHIDPVPDGDVIKAGGWNRRARQQPARARNEKAPIRNGYGGSSLSVAPSAMEWGAAGVHLTLRFIITERRESQDTSFPLNDEVWPAKEASYSQQDPKIVVKTIIDIIPQGGSELHSGRNERGTLNIRDCREALRHRPTWGVPSFWAR